MRPVRSHELDPRRRCTAARTVWQSRYGPILPGVWSMTASIRNARRRTGPRARSPSSPTVWLDIAALVDRERDAARGFSAPALANPRIRVVLTGAGTSAYIGACLAPALAQHLGRRVEAVATTDLVSGPHSIYDAKCPRCWCHSHARATARRASRRSTLAERALDEVHHLVITCNADRPAGSADGWRVERLRTRASGQHQRSRVRDDLELHLDGARRGTDVRRRSRANASASLGACLRYRRCRCCRPPRVISPRATSNASSISAAMDCRRWRAEAALKMLELTDGRIVALAHSALGFRHGPKTDRQRPHAGRGVRLQRSVYARLRSRPARRAAARRPCRRHRRGGRGRHGRCAAGTRRACRTPAISSSRWSTWCLRSVSGFASRFNCGLTPDNPNVAGVVSRVVQGRAHSSLGWKWRRCSWGLTAAAPRPRTC